MHFVLVVEPNAVLQELLCLQLAREDRYIHAVTSIGEALVCLNSVHVDLVATELRFDGSSGTIFLQSMKARGYTTPVLAISTELSPPPGFDAYLRKPYKLADLHKIVQTLLEGTATHHATFPYTLPRAPLPERSATPGTANR